MYKGLWVDGMRHGQGVETHYEGGHYHEALVDGYDPLLKVVFTGEFKWNARHGKGRTEWYRTRTPADGGAPVEEVVKWVKGEWRNDGRHGAFEEWRMVTGTPAEAAEVPIHGLNWVERTVGEYVRGKRTTGTSYWDTGQKQYEGQWLTSRDSEHTVMHGEGTYYSRSGIKVYTGTFDERPAPRTGPTLSQRRRDALLRRAVAERQVARRGQPLQSKWDTPLRRRVWTGSTESEYVWRLGRICPGRAATHPWRRRPLGGARQTCRQTRTLACKVPRCGR